MRSPGYRNPTPWRNLSSGWRSSLTPSDGGAFKSMLGACPDVCSLVPADGGIQVPAPLDKLYGLYCRELGEGSLNRLLLLQSVVAGNRQVRPPRLSMSPPAQPGPLACVRGPGGTHPPMKGAPVLLAEPRSPAPGHIQADFRRGQPGPWGLLGKALLGWVLFTPGLQPWAVAKNPCGREKPRGRKSERGVALLPQ